MSDTNWDEYYDRVMDEMDAYILSGEITKSKADDMTFREIVEFLKERDANIREAI